MYTKYIYLIENQATFLIQPLVIRISVLMHNVKIELIFRMTSPIPQNKNSTAVFCVCV